MAQLQFACCSCLYGFELRSITYLMGKVFGTCSLRIKMCPLNLSVCMITLLLTVLLTSSPECICDYTKALLMVLFIGLMYKLLLATYQ